MSARRSPNGADDLARDPPHDAEVKLPRDVISLLVDGGSRNKVLDCVIRHFNASSAGMKKMGLDLHWDRRLTRLPGPTETQDQSQVGRFFKARRETGFWFRAELDTKTE
jgi:hypothetical protein